MYSPDYVSNESELNLLCVNSKYGNFTKGKIYKAKAWSMNMRNKFTHFRIDDDDHDLYTIREKHLIENNKLYFKIINNEV